MMRSLYVMPIVVVSSSLFFAYWFYRIRRSGAFSKKTINKVVFFPDKATAKLLSRSRKRTNLQGSSLLTLMESIQSARHSLDVCMFTMACKELGEVLIKAHRDRITVRVITDAEQTGAYGSQIKKLRRAGIRVRMDKTTFFMHHKFVVVDNKVLVNGSLNWTNQGVCGNQENVLITNNSELVQPFVKQFEHLWQLYTTPGGLRLN